MNLMESLLANKLAAKQSSGGSNLTPEVKEALLDCFANVAWAVEDGQQYYDALADALYGLQSISAVYTQSGTVYDTDSLDSLKADLVVTALYGDGSTQTVPAESYTLSGTLTVGTSTITVSYGGKTATFDVVVTQTPLLPLDYQQVEWIQSSGGEVINTGAGILEYGQSDQIARYTIEADIAVTETNPNTAIVMSKGIQSGCWLGLTNSGASIGLGNVTFSGINMTERHNYKMHWTGSGNSRTGYCVCDGQTISRAVSIVDLEAGITFFNSNNKQYPAKCRIYQAKVTEDDVLIRDLYPCYRKADGVIGMFDIANDVFYVNTGTGTFTKGADV